MKNVRQENDNNYVGAASRRTMTETVKFVVNFQGSKGNNVVSRENVCFSLNAMHGHDVHVVMTEKNK